MKSVERIRNRILEQTTNNNLGYGYLYGQKLRHPSSGIIDIVTIDGESGACVFVDEFSHAGSINAKEIVDPSQGWDILEPEKFYENFKLYRKTIKSLMNKKTELKRVAEYNDFEIRRVREKYEIIPESDYFEDLED
jgi:hypothetical protein